MLRHIFPLHSFLSNAIHTSTSLVFMSLLITWSHVNEKGIFFFVYLKNKKILWWDLFYQCGGNLCVCVSFAVDLISHMIERVVPRNKHYWTGILLRGNKPLQENHSCAYWKWQHSLMPLWLKLPMNL